MQERHLIVSPLNTAQQLILEFLKYTNQPIFLTGKAGTGKTTLLRQIRESTEKNFAVVAPTAVAAINAGGVTLHSFFQIPFGPLVPVQKDAVEVMQEVKYSPEKIKLLRCLELLIIDEISMVRADLIDFIDDALRKVKGSESPFGGIQVLMIGDLYQLSPIAHDAWHILKAYYPSPYFFDSQVLRSISMTTFQLDKVYRQSDPVFLEILNGIRENNLDATLLQKLNESYDAGLEQVWKEDYITLTTHNHLVTQINQECLDKLEGDVHTFKARVTGDFPKDAYPVDELLHLKVGAQVMFIKNDSSGKKQYYNGKAAKITSIEDQSIKVCFTDDSTPFEVSTEEWQNVKYNLDPVDNKINEDNTGTFNQYPFKLAWAITVHKSQGLTFDKAIVDVSSSFTHGQAYVALSRCRSLEGLLLKSPVKTENIITDARVIEFTRQAVGTKPDVSALELAKIAFEWNQINDLLNFQSIKKHWDFLKKSKIHQEIGNRGFHEILSLIQLTMEDEVIKVAERFKHQELSRLSKTIPFKQETAFMERLQKASTYFLPKIKAVLNALNQIATLNLYMDERTEKIINRVQDCKAELNIKLALLDMPWAQFSTELYIRTYHRASYTTDKTKADKPVEKVMVPKEITNVKLYEALLDFRKTVSEKRNVAEHQVLSELAIQSIAAKPPKTTEQLAAIKSVGIGNAVELGPQILKVINQFMGTTELF